MLNYINVSCFKGFVMSSEKVLNAGEVSNHQDGSLDYNAAIQAHMKWKITLKHYIKGLSSDHIDHDLVCKDDQCPLGKWIYGQMENMGDNDVFMDVKHQHAMFHKIAGKVVSLVNEGDENSKKEAEKVFQGPYVEVSQKVITSIQNLQKQQENW